jgi:hypothetical protein
MSRSLDEMVRRVDNRRRRGRNSSLVIREVGGTRAAEPVAPAGRLRPWAATVVATAVSTYALDGVATAAGVLLVASGALGDLGHWHALVFLAATYAAWGIGLRANLRANWSLLEQTGMSTNALSKAAYDLTRLRRSGVRDRRIASAAGYLGLELAKEAPYYAGAFGAAVLSDSVSSTDAIVFLAGTNVGAAGYEYGLAGLTRFVLRVRYPQACVSPDTDPVPGKYLAEHSSRVEPDETRTSNASSRTMSLGRHDQDDDCRGPCCSRQGPPVSPVLRILGVRGPATGHRPSENPSSAASGPASARWFAHPRPPRDRTLFSTGCAALT